MKKKQNDVNLTIVMKKTVIFTTVLVETSPQALPLGAACVASAVGHSPLLKDKVNVKLLDFSREEEKYRGEDAYLNITNEILSCDTKQPWAVCFSVYMWNRQVLTQVAKELKKRNSQIICIAGGPEATANPMSMTGFDFAVCGAGEIAVPELLAKLLDSENPDLKKTPCVQGVYVPSENDLTQAQQALVRALPPSPENAVSPYLDGMIDVAKYGGALWELARGCPFKCAYCYESKGEKKIQYFPLERLEKELDLFREKKIAQVFVLDPTYNANKERALEMLKLIKKKTPNTFYYFEARAEFIDKPLARAFASIPCCLQIGLQSADENVLQKVHRTLNKKLFVKNIGYLNETGAIFGFDLIFALPTDTFAGFCNSIDFALSLYPNNLELFCLSVLPGTALAETAEGLGLKWQKEPPYQVIDNTTFPASDIEKARNLSRAVNIFYTQGRAVPWFLSALKPLKMKPSAFFKEFEKFLREKHFSNAGSSAAIAENGAVPDELDIGTIEALQKDFVAKLYKQKHLEKLTNLALDLIAFHGALSRCTADGTESTLTLHYHADDLMSEYATDFRFFAENAKVMKCRVKVFASKYGADYRVM